MKKNLLRLLAIISVMFVSISLSAQLSIVIDESFENGLPEAWTQEQVSGDFSWVVEQGEALSSPRGAYDGAKRIAFRNLTGQSQGYVTRLITPVMKLVGVYQPILCFAHAQDKYAGDFDTLRVLYRTSADVEWTELAVYTEYMPAWRMDTLGLVGVNDSYQLAFEAKDNLGRGIVLDKIVVRSRPNCLQPDNLTAMNIENDKATVSWNGSFDTKTFHVRVSSEALTKEQLVDAAFKANIADSLIGGEFYNLALKDLEQGKLYYFYVKANCEGESSDWSAEGTFRTSNLVDIPYYENFNKPYNPGFISKPNGWVCYSSTDEYSPLINTNEEKSVRANYSRDSTTALFIGNGSSTSATVDPGDFVYAATPQLNTEDVSKLQVHFWSNQYYLRSDTSAIIVGVMTDPGDVNTFTAVDTLFIEQFRVFTEFIVPLTSYTGTGKYVALLSKFDFENHFVLDDFVIEETSKVAKATFDVKLLDATSITYDFDATYSKYEVIVADTLLDLSNIDQTRVKVQKELTANLQKADNLTPWTEYYTYARYISGTDKGEWSNPVLVRTPESASILPHLIDFEINTSDPTTFYVPYKERGGIGKLSNGVIALSNVYSSVKSTNSYKSTYDYDPVQRTPYELSFYVSDNDYAIAAMPYIENVRDSRVTFWYCQHSDSYMYNFYIGMMTDVNDYTTFEPLDTIYTEAKFVRCVVDLSKYNGQGHFFAIKVDKTSMKDASAYSNQAFIDDLTIEQRPSCKEPSNIKAIPADSTATLSWEANGVTKWNFRMSDSEIHYDSLYSETYNGKYIHNKVIENITSLKLTNLKAGGTTYYCYLQPVCGEVEGAWTSAISFVTNCYAKYQLPYVMNFDEPFYLDFNTDKRNFIPCLYTQKMTSSCYNGSCSYTPYITSYGALTGEQCLQLNSGKGTYTYWTYVAFPEMDEELKNLQLTFHLKSSNLDSKVAVGIMTDPNDSLTFDTLAVVSPAVKNEWNEALFTFSNYKGAGKHIALRSATPSQFLYIDSVLIQVKPACPTVQALEVLATTDVSATVRWRPDTETAWNIVASTKELTREELNAAKAGVKDVVYVGSVTKNPTTTITGLQANTPYFYYVQSDCGAGTLGVWSRVGWFRTNCVMLDAGATGVENFDTYGVGNEKYPPCYVVGNKLAPDNASFTPQCSGTYKHSGAASLQIKSTTTNNGAYAITSKIDIDTISKLMVRFWGTAASNTTSQYAHKLLVGVITDPYDLATWTPLDTVDFSSVGQQYEVRFDKYDGDYQEDFGQYVMFFSEFDKNNTVYIDDVVFDTIPECSAIVSVDSIGTDKVKLSFIGGAAPYRVKVSSIQLTDEQLNSEDAIAGVTAYNAPSNKLLVESLLANQTYYLYVQATCGDKFSDWSIVEQFTTNCESLLQLPYFEDFDAYKKAGTYNLPTCWNTYYNSLENLGQYPHIYSSGYSNKGLYIYAGSTEKVSYAVTQELDVDALNKCQVSFFAKPSTSSYQRSLVIGVVDNVATSEDLVKTFVPVDTIIIPKGVKTYEKYSISLEKYAGTGKHLGFTTAYDLNFGSSAGKGSSGGVYIDNVSIEIIPTCPRPDFLTLKDLGDTYAKVAFTNLSSASSFEVEYGLKGFVEGTGTKQTITDTIATLTGLTEKTDYEFRVRALCDANDKSLWSVLNFRTIAAVFTTFPYNCDFNDEAENSNWTFMNDANQWIIGNLYPDPLAKSNKALYITDGDSAKYVSGSMSYSWATRPIKLSKGVYEISLDWAGIGESNYDFMRIGLLPTGAIFAAGDDAVAYNGVTVDLSKDAKPNGWIELNVEDKTPKFNMYEKATAEAPFVHNRKTIIVPEEVEGTYNLVVFWKNDGSGGKNPSGVVDNITIDKATCNLPVDLKLTAISDISAIFEWKDIESAPKNYQFVMFTEEGMLDTMPAEKIIKNEIVTGKRYEAKGLTPSTKYYVYVRANCSDKEQSYWTSAYFFETACKAIDNDTVFNFDTEDAFYYPTYVTGNNTSSPVPNCFTIGTSAKDLPYNSTNDDYYPFLEDNTTNNTYARSGKYSLLLKSSKEANIGGYIALPLFENEFTDKQISFWMRPFYGNSSQKVSTTGLDEDYARKITVGSMSDPTDPSTFKEIATVQYPYSKVELTTKTYLSEDIDGEKYWRQFVIPLTDVKDKYIAFKCGKYGKFVENQMYIDDVAVEPLFSCITPHTLLVDKIKTTSAELNFTHVDGVKWAVMLSDSASFADTLSIDTITTLPYKIENLKSGTDYFVQVQQLCGDEENSDFSSIATFTTAYSAPFDEDFNKTERVPAGWTRAVDPEFAELISGEEPFSFSDNSVSGGWSYETALFTNGKFSTIHTSVGVAGSSTDYWLFTPTIEMPNKDDLQLVFDLALTDRDNNSAPLGDDLLNPDDKFIVVISEDAGATWTEANATIWGNTEDDVNKFNSIPNTGAEYKIDLAKYAGKTIKVAFYAESTVSNATVDMHLDNVHINSLVKKPAIDEVCETNDYYSEHFNITSDNLQVGQNEFSKMLLSYGNTPDTLYTLNLTVNPMSRSFIPAAICEGETYTGNGFTATREMVYTRKLQSASGCDSVAYLNLTVTPASRVTHFDTICQGATYVFNGIEYNRTGAYIDTLSSKVTGCDSIVTLMLRVNDALVSAESRTICHGESYNFGKFGNITKSGTYVDTLASPSGCDSIVTLTLNVLDEMKTTIDATICEGEEYNENGFKGVTKTGVYPLPLQSVDGCDSVITLNLTVLSGDTTRVEREITTNDLPYTYEGKTYDENTQPGVYVDTFNISTGKCDNVIILTLTVTEPVGVDNVSMRSLTITPNPVSVGAVLRIGAEFTAEEREGLVVEVFNAVGQRVYRAEPGIYPIEIEGLQQTGTYIVRITTGSGTRHQGKIIVK